LDRRTKVRTAATLYAQYPLVFTQRSAFASRRIHCNYDRHSRI